MPQSLHLQVPQPGSAASTISKDFRAVPFFNQLVEKRLETVSTLTEAGTLPSHCATFPQATQRLAQLALLSLRRRGWAPSPTALLWVGLPPLPAPSGSPTPLVPPMLRGAAWSCPNRLGCLGAVQELPNSPSTVKALWGP